MKKVASPSCPLSCLQASSFWANILYINVLNNAMFLFSDFISLVHDKIKIEKIAATLNDKRKSGNSFSLVKACQFKTCNLFLEVKTVNMFFNVLEVMLVS